MKLINQGAVSFENGCGAMYDEEELIKAAMWYCDKPICRRKKVSMYGKYPSVSLYETKIHIHRLLMMFWLGGEIPDGFQVHHIDGNKLNALKENLALVPSGTHQSYHNLGKTLSDEHRQKISDRNKERRGVRHKQKKPNITPQMIYEMRTSGMSFNKISKIVGLDWGCVKQRYNDYLHDNPELLKGGEGA
jgi:hypothetical protein